MSEEKTQITPYLDTPQHNPTMYNKQKVRAMTFTGIPQERQAQILGISTATLHRYYKNELKFGLCDGVQVLSETAFAMALDGNVPMLQLLLKTKGATYGFVEKQQIEHGVTKELEDLSLKIKELEQSHDKDY